MVKFGIVMDPIANININKDSSFAIMLEAQRRNYKIYYMEVNDLYLIKGEARAHTRIINVEQNNNQWYEFKSEQDLSLDNLDVILIRKDPPFNIQYLYCTYILEHAEKKGVLLINKPQSLRNYNEKLYTTWFTDLIPETLVTCNKMRIKKFWQQHKDIIVKPLNEMGGTLVFRIKEDDPNVNVIIDTITKNGTVCCIAQIYITDIINGDKRILIIDGEPIPYCLARIAQCGETRSNLAVGGYGEVRPLTIKDWRIAHYLSPILRENGLIIVGLDIIGNYLTEINITSPTCIREIENTLSISVTSIIMDAIEKRLKS